MCKYFTFRSFSACIHATIRSLRLHGIDNSVFLSSHSHVQKVSGIVFLSLKATTLATTNNVCIRGLHLHLFKWNMDKYMWSVHLVLCAYNSSIIQNVY